MAVSAVPYVLLLQLATYKGINSVIIIIIIIITNNKNNIICLIMIVTFLFE